MMVQVFSQEFSQVYVEDENENEIEYVYVDSGELWDCEYADFEDGVCHGCETPGICVDPNNPHKKVCFRIRQRYFDKIVSGEKTEEIRTLKPFWIKQLFTGTPPQVATFICGKDVHRRWITGIYIDDAVEVLGRELSEQGQKDVLDPDSAIIIKLGSIYSQQLRTVSDSVVSADEPKRETKKKEIK